MEPKFKNDSERLKTEYSELPKKNKELYELVQDICEYCSTEFKKDAVVTMIYRTEEEQDSIYKDDPKYKLRKFKSPHQLWDAIDLRSNTYTEEEIKKLVEYINSKYDQTNVYNWTSKNHTVGLGFHFHVQYQKKS